MDTQYKKIRSLTLRQIIYALAAADEGNVTAAARKLHVSQPAVSSAIAALEQHYGMKLFTRLPARGVVLTPFGVKVMSEARLLCDHAQTVALLATPEAEIAGEVGLCCYETVAPFVLPRLLRRLEERLPAVSVRISEEDLESTATSLKHGRADLAITYDIGLKADVFRQDLYTLQPHVICSAGHQYAKQKSIKLESLHQQKIILLEQPFSAQYVLGLLRARGVEPEIAMSVKSVELQRSMVANDFGIALAHTLPKTQLSYDGTPICAIPIANKMVESRVQIACLHQNRNRPVLQAILAEVSAIFTGKRL